MGMITDLKNLDSVNPTLNANATKRVLKRYIQDLEEVSGDPDYIDADVSEQFESHQVQQHVPTVSGGTYDLIFDLASGETFSAINIAYDAVVAVIQTAVDDAAVAANITGWTTDAIFVFSLDAGLNDGSVLFIFGGASVMHRRQPLVQIDGTNLTGGGSAGAVIILKAGQPNRPAAAVAKLIGLLAIVEPISVLPQFTDYVGEPGNLHLNPNELVLKMLAIEFGIEANKFGTVYPLSGTTDTDIHNEHLKIMRKKGFAV